MNPKLRRQVGVYATLFSLTLVYRLFAPNLKGEALGGLLFLAFAGGVGVNFLFDKGYKTWAVVLIAGSLMASCLALYGLLNEGVPTALVVGVVLLIPAFVGLQWGCPKKINHS